MRTTITLLFALLSVSWVKAQQQCPADLGWYKYDEDCYRFEAFPRLDMLSAAGICEQDGAALLSVGSSMEHEFVTDWLLNNDPSRLEWLTSGITTSSGVTWQADSTTSTAAYWIDDSTNNVTGAPVLYAYSVDMTEYGWKRGSSQEQYAFICEIKLSEVYKIVQEVRDFDYGLDVENPSDAPRGPTFLQEPQDTIVLGDIEDVPSLSLECLADGNPEPSYEWLVLQDQKYVEVKSEGRFTFTTGKLEIRDPVASDENSYQCRATNEIGISLSKAATLTFGTLDEFPVNPSSTVVGYEYQGGQMECPEITAKPGKTYQWYKNSATNFVRPQYQKHIFMSSNGRLYFSELAPSDAGTYFCVVDLFGYGFGGLTVSVSSKSAVSLGFDLEVVSAGGGQYQPDIQPEFPYVFPASPVRGGDAMIECFAYGTGPLIYSWYREDGKPLPEGYYFDSNDRILMLTDLELADGGVYWCKVQSTTTMQEDSKWTELIVQALPYFTYPLAHMHLDVNTKLTWHCEAAGMPEPTYSWYKDGEVIISDSMLGRTINRNSLTLEKVTTDHEGMYQCAATNIYGTTFSTAQLRVLELAPSFEKEPMTKTKSAALDGQVTLYCNPVAAPSPTFQWIKDGGNLNLNIETQSDADHYQLLRSGGLFINKVEQFDQGRYTCLATNDYGEASDYTDLMVLEATVISDPPSNDKVEVNLTATLLCSASHSPEIDMIYVWKFNDHIIDFYIEPEYRQGEGSAEGTLYIVATQFRHEGTYTCEAMTSMDSFSASAYLTVLGPPGEAAGISVKSDDEDIAGSSLASSNDPPNVATTRWVVWTDGDDHGGDISHYFVEFRTQYDQTWRVHPDANNIPTYMVTNDQYAEQRVVMLTDLKAYAGVEFRVLARNVYGIGAPSQPTDITQIEGAKPTVTVSNIRGGGGSVGDLTILWDPLPQEDHNGPNLKYYVGYREYEPNVDNAQWRWTEVGLPHDDICYYSDVYIDRNIQACQYVVYVGDENYYLDYEIQIYTENDYGDGPYSEIANIKSAEDLPVGTPEDIHGWQYNATALRITWKPVPNTREAVHGTLKGYKILYWRKDFEEESDALQNILELKPGQDNLAEGIIIGLEPRLWYRFAVLVYNSAGNGDKSSSNVQQTFNMAPANYPTEVHVFSVEGFGVRVNFRGISTKVLEEPLRGYKVQFWKSNENILGAEEADFGMMTTGVIRNLTSSEIYQLRVYGYSRAGQGQRSSPSIYFTVGDGQIVVNSETTEIMSGAGVRSPSVVLLLLAAVSLLLVSRW